MACGIQFKFNTLMVSALVLAGLTACEGDTEKVSVSDVMEIHDRVITLDSHVDISSDYTYKPAFDPGHLTSMKVDLPKMVAGGLDGAFFIVYVGQTKRTPENYAAAKALALRKFDAIHRMTDELYPDRIGLAFSPQEVRDIIDSGRKVAVIGIENGYVIGTDLDLVEDYYNRGARYMTLAHNGHNDICDSAQPKEDFGDVAAEHGGVSDFGKQVIGEMNRVGMMVDISHVSQDCMVQAVNLSRAPAIASHSGVRALADHPRNLTDEQMKLLAARGGVMQLVAYTGFVKADPARNQAEEALMQKIAAENGWAANDYEKIELTPAWKTGHAALDRKYPIATVAEFVDQIDYAVKLIGIDHVGISSDFDGGGGITGWDDASESLSVTRELLSRGYSEADIAKIWGGNLLRVWEEVDRIARESAP
ncbi:dipeptidase [Paremcibacter congregatus]|uniref:dipeptidase n=1 Tax=Paremcibacter congregatus TaxID=2043170 RepID=UPI0030EEA16B